MTLRPFEIVPVAGGATRAVVVRDVSEHAPRPTRAPRTSARVSRATVATVCGHLIDTGERGPVRRYCLDCRDVPALLMRLRQARALAVRLGRPELAAKLAEFISSEAVRRG